MRIYLVGYMGSGKSTVGAELANRLGFEFLDLDEYIQEMTGFSIVQIFRSQGEEYFRALEGDMLRRTGLKENLIIATGGGCPIHHQNMDWINENGTSVYLKITPQTAFERLKNSRQERPLINGLKELNLLSCIEGQMEQREPFYAKAHRISLSENLDMDELVELFQSK